MASNYSNPQNPYRPINFNSPTYGAFDDEQQTPNAIGSRRIDNGTPKPTSPYPSGNGGPGNGTDTSNGGNGGGGGGGGAVPLFGAGGWGSALIGGIGSGLSAFGQYQNEKQQRQLEALKYLSDQAQNQFNTDRNFRANQANGVLNADSLGADQQYAQKNGLMAAILPNLRNTQSHPGDAGVAGAMGGNRGGIMNALGPNGLDPDMIQRLYGDTSTAAAIAKRNSQLLNLDPNHPITDLNNLYNNQGAQATNLQNYQNTVQNAQNDQRNRYDQQLSPLLQAILSRTS